MKILRQESKNYLNNEAQLPTQAICNKGFFGVERTITPSETLTAHSLGTLWAMLGSRKIINLKNKIIWTLKTKSKFLEKE